jgi:hypothetical protein
MPNIAKCTNCNQFDVPGEKASDEICSRCKPFQYEVGVKTQLPDRELTATKKVTATQQGEEKVEEFK